MDWWTAVRWIGAGAALLGGLGLSLVMVRDWRAGVRHDTQRGFLAMGVGSLCTALSLILSRDADVLRLVVTLLGAACMWTGLRWISRAEA